MAVDANVLVFERAREEYAARSSRSLRAAPKVGFRNALSAFADSNVTTLLAAGLLFFLASGPVRGFGVTLSIGVLASVVSALVVTRVLAEWAVNRRAVRLGKTVDGVFLAALLTVWVPRTLSHSLTWGVALDDTWPGLVSGCAHASRSGTVSTRVTTIRLFDGDPCIRLARLACPVRPRQGR